MSIYKIINLTGTFIINNLVFSRYKFLKESQSWNLNRLKKYQIDKLGELLRFAYKNSEYYIRIFKKNGIHPSEIKSFEDLKRIPPIKKKELLQNAKIIQVKDCQEKLVYSETSGSTGEPLVFYRNKDWDAWHRASAYRGYSWYDVRPWDKSGYLWGYNFSLKKRLKTKVLDALQNRFRLFSYNDDEINNFIRKLSKADFMQGYSSMIYEIAKRINIKGAQPHSNMNLKMVLGTSEKIFDKYQHEAKKAFGRKIVGEYGAAEAGIIAFECPYGNMHINMETVVVEEEKNRIIVTNLVSKSFPIIRYQLGDYIELDKETVCACGMKHLIIKEVTGRVGKVIQGGKDQYPSLMLYYVFKNLAMDHKIILNYQVVQTQKGNLEVYIEELLLENQKELLMNEFKKYFYDDIRIKLIEKSNFLSRSAKKKDFISKIS